MTLDPVRAAAQGGEGPETAWHPRFGLVLILICATFIFISAAPTEKWAILVSVALLCGTLMAAARTAKLSHAGRIITAVTALLLLAGALIALLAPDGTAEDSDARGAAFVLMAAAIGMVAPIIVSGVIHDLRTRGATAQAVLGAISLFILLGILFAGVYGAVANIDDGAFFTDGTDGDLQIRLYFSFVTLTTLGYGDFAPASDVGRSMATVEALSGQLYLVTIIAVLVGNLGRKALRDRE